MLKRGVLIFLAALLLISFTACGGEKNSKHTDTAAVKDSADAGGKTGADGKDSSKQGENQAAEKEEPKIDGDFIFPTAGTRPIAVMIDNEGTRCLPQGGLYKAQVIYEIIVEGGVTRLMPVFWGVDPEMIGPVRSSRHYFLDYAMENDAIYVHFGWSPRAMSDIKKLKINNIDGITNAGSIFWDLTKNRNNWQDSYTSMKNIKSFISRVKYRTTTQKALVFHYNDSNTVLKGGSKAEKISLKYSYYECSYIYNNSTGLYSRFRKGKPHMERITGKQLTARNIIIQMVQNNTISGDTKDRQDLKDIGSGKGWFITGGKAVEIKWSKSSRSERTVYTDGSGKEIKLNPGQTWIQVIPVRGQVVIG